MSSGLESLTTTVGVSDPFPILNSYGQVYSEKGIRTVFFSIGSSKSALADLQIAETIGCPINIFPLSEAEAESWKGVATCLKDRTAGANPFLEGVDKIWVLPKNIRVRSALPWWEEGNIVVNGVSQLTNRVEKVVSEVCNDIKVKDGAQRIDILKVDTGSHLERGILHAILDAGFRPGILLINWTETPDSNMSTTIAAGHLQNCGYILLAKEGNKYHYYFVDDDLYAICSWEQLANTNPIVTEVVRAFKEKLYADKTKTLR